MALRKVVTEEDPILRKKSRPVTDINGRIHTLLDDMAETMYASDGVGLAAPQVGTLRRVVVIDVRDDNGLIELINPEILEQEGSNFEQEGCLSVPGLIAKVERPDRVKVKALNRIGEEVIYEAEGFLAKAFCHEIDHLEGMLFIDKPHEVIEDDEE